MYGIRIAGRYRTPLIVIAVISVAIGIVAVLLFTRPEAGDSKVVESPQTEISEPIPTAFVVASPDPRGAAVSEPPPSEPLVAQASQCGSGAAAGASLNGGNSGLVIMDGQVSAGELISVPIVLTQAPAGLAGYDVRLSVDDPSIASLANIHFPDFGIVREVEASKESARIAAADLFRVVEVGAADSTLATVIVEGTNKGSTFIHLSIVRMDDDSGDPMTPQVYSGTVTVC